MAQAADLLGDEACIAAAVTDLACATKATLCSYVRKCTYTDNVIVSERLSIRGTFGSPAAGSCSTPRTSHSRDSKSSQNAHLSAQGSENVPEKLQMDQALEVRAVMHTIGPLFAPCLAPQPACMKLLERAGGHRQWTPFTFVQTRR